MVRNDGIDAVDAHVEINVVHLTTGLKSSVFSGDIALPAGPGVARAFAPNQAWKASMDGHHVFTSVVTTAAAASSMPPLSSHVILPAQISDLQIAPTKVTVDVHALASCPFGNSKRQCVPLSLTSSPAPALYVTLTSASQGRFSENSVFVFEPAANNSTSAAASFTRGVYFYPFDGAAGAELFDMNKFKSSLRIEEVSMYLVH
jgi:hypothetical protein